MSRGQVALEFIITYGWAILAFLVIAGALGYFTGAFSYILPTTCTTPQPFSCAQFKVAQDGTVFLGILNAQTTEIASVNVSVCGQSYATTALKSQTLINGSGVMFHCNVTGTRFRTDFRITYVRPDQTVSHYADGFLRAHVEK